MFRADFYPASHRGLRNLQKIATTGRTINGRCESSGMKLVDASQLLRREPLFVRPESRERRLQPLGEAGRAIVVAHTIEDIGHGVLL